MSENNLLQNKTLNETEYQDLLKYINAKTGMIFASRLKLWVTKQLETVFDVSGGSDINEFARKIIANQKPKETQVFFDSLTVNETMFFRDKKYFEFIQNIMIPEIIKNNNKLKSLSIWIAAGSSGQEAYSILFNIHSNFPELKTWNVSILSTDLCGQVVAKASKGIYEAHEVNRGLDGNYLGQFFDQIDSNHWQVKPEYRSKIRFSESNLVESYAAFLNADFISCRNVLIYFNEVTKADIIKRLADKVKANGYLVLGQVDYINAGKVPERFEYKIDGTFPYYKRAG